MKNSLLIMILSSVMAFSAGAQPQAYGQAGGFSGPQAGGINSVKQVLDAGVFSDDTPVTLTGNIVNSLGGDLYTFSDGTGTVTVEIDSDKWFGLQANPQTKVTILGEIDKEFHKMKIDVDSIRLAQ